MPQRHGAAIVSGPQPGEHAVIAANQTLPVLRGAVRARWFGYGRERSRFGNDDFRRSTRIVRKSIAGRQHDKKNGHGKAVHSSLQMSSSILRDLRWYLRDAVVSIGNQ
jgi:hypothetical protein